MGTPTLTAWVPGRWWAGEWQQCSSSCGPGGLSRRAVLCIQSVGLDEQSALEPPACAHLPRPPAETPCNRHVPCPATWAVGDWSQVSISTGGPGPSSAIGLGLWAGGGRLQGALTSRPHGGREGGGGIPRLARVPIVPGTRVTRQPAATTGHGLELDGARESRQRPLV